MRGIEGGISSFPLLVHVRKFSSCPFPLSFFLLYFHGPMFPCLSLPCLALPSPPFPCPSHSTCLSTHLRPYPILSHTKSAEYEKPRNSSCMAWESTNERNLVSLSTPSRIRCEGRERKGHEREDKTKRNGKQAYHSAPASEPASHW